ncbi:MAG: apolipoprotein N-acyltransferase [Deltaproteobacteria bacterium]|nr:apolipoprotein N-acyltransferase [Deltaproteobacteria bacterium]
MTSKSLNPKINLDMKRFVPTRASLGGAISGLLLALAFPSASLPILAWLGLIPLVLTMHERPFKSGFVAGCTFFGIVLYWLNIVMTTYGHLPLALSIVAYLCLVAYLAFFWGTATWVVCRLKERRHYHYSMTLPVVWVAMEFLRAFLLTGFPWAQLGYSQQPWLVMIQSADLFGVYGVTFLLVLSGTVLAESILALQSKHHAFPSKACIAFVVLLTMNFGYGFWRMSRQDGPNAETIRVGLIQGNIPQEMKWRPDQQHRTMQTYTALSLKAADNKPVDLLVWPEAATPFYYQDGGKLAAMVSTLPHKTGSALLFGSPAYRRDDGQIRYLNSAFLLTPEQGFVGRSDKIHLVPFGEYVPLGQFLPFIDKLVVGIGDFSPGDVNPLPLNGHQLGVLICYEVIFPELARDYVRQGADLLVNITNDAWFGRSSAPWQHLGMAAFRAVENRVWIVRSANTGISALIDPSGRIESPSELFEPAVVVGDVRPGGRSTFYMQTGDSLPSLFLAIALVWLWQTRRRYL